MSPRNKNSEEKEKTFFGFFALIPNLVLFGLYVHRGECPILIIRKIKT